MDKTRHKLTDIDRELWPKFVVSQNYFFDMPTTSINQSFEETFYSTIKNYPSLLSPDSYPGDMAWLKTVLTEAAFKKISGRYRTYKTRHHAPVKTLTLKQETIERLQRFAASNGFAYDNYDQLLEYLIDPEERLEHEKAVEIPATAITQDQQFNIARAKLQLRPHTWRTILIAIEQAYRAGWLACKYLSGAKRTEQSLDEHAQDYMNRD